MENLLDKTAKNIVNRFCDILLMPESSKETAKKIIIAQMIDLIKEVYPYALED